jgi:hypothetical protein
MPETVDFKCSALYEDEEGVERGQNTVLKYS